VNSGKRIGRSLHVNVHKVHSKRFTSNLQAASRPAKLKGSACERAVSSLFDLLPGQRRNDFVVIPARAPDHLMPIIGDGPRIGLPEPGNGLLHGHGEGREERIPIRPRKAAGHILLSWEPCGGATSRAWRWRSRPDILDDRDIAGSVIGGNE